MKLTLKNIKHTEWASEETHCYQAALYVDGKPVAIVSNDGHGGCDRDYAHPKFEGDYRATMKAVHDYFQSLPKTDEWLEDGVGVSVMEQCLEFWCGDQVNDWLSARELKKKLKAGFLFQLADGVGVFAHKERPPYKATILNDLPFSEALAIWKETTNA
jgi:hypothetical protein